jgi:histone H3/H4
MRKKTNALRNEIVIARRIWGRISQVALDSLTQLVERFGVSVSSGDVQLLDGRWYITHSGLLRISQRRHCSGIKSTLIERYSDPAMTRWVFKAVVHKTPRSRGFVGYGDADPSNVSPLVRGAEMRVAETRAVNRALRKAYGIGLCSVEELGSFSPPMPASHPKQTVLVSCNGNGSNHSQPRLRDQLCLLIRQHNLDPALVKAYAADFCGTETLKEASRDLVESFISHLAKAAKEDRDALVCKLNSYAQPEVATS